jgi:CMP-N,N'-diacetyllegionaminic acid synthase
MTSAKRILGIIPARGGSKGIPRKNIADLGGHPLIAWTAVAATGAQGLERVIVSTDDAEIAATAGKYGVEVPYLRPPEISSDTASATEVIRHALNFYAAQDIWYDAVAYLQPTSPFRRSGHISDALALFARLSPDTLVSVQQVPHNMSAGSVMRPLGASPDLFLESPAGQKLRRQDKEVLFARNGPAILVCSAADVLQRDRLYGENVVGFPMDGISSHDIDEPLDLDIARCLLPLTTFA